MTDSEEALYVSKWIGILCLQLAEQQWQPIGGHLHCMLGNIAQTFHAYRVFFAQYLAASR